MSHWLDDVFNNSVRNNFISNGINTFTCTPNCSFPWNFKSNRHYEYHIPLELEIKKVIFNGPATIVLWNDGTKTVVKCSKNEEFDPEKGVAMAVWKKFLPEQYGRKAERMIAKARVKKLLGKLLKDADAKK